MKIIVLNCGSSSIKYQLFNMPENEVVAKGLVDKVGLKGASIKHKRNDGKELKIEGEILDHQAGIEYLLGILIDKEYGSLNSLNEIQAVGHRVVHGAEEFSGSVAITPEVVAALEKWTDLAPLHNPPNLKGIYAMQQLLPDVPQAGVFDTAFHQTMPEYSYLYGIPYSLYEKHKIRRYGFHGTSHKYVSARACEVLGLDINKTKIVTCHLGNGASLAAVLNGKSLDTSMGMTPLEGVMMGTRAGDLDIGALFHIINKENMNLKTANTLVNKFSGILGVSGISSDMRDVEKAAADGNHRAQESLKMYAYRVRKYIGAYAAAMGGLDVVVFTGGIGENDALTRAKAMEGLEFLGIDFDFDLNKTVCAKEITLTRENSKVKVVIIPTNEELMIAKDTYEIVTK
ncbi:MAG TPA: acetate kinase [Bacteroidales bacterium]|nr:acetate kinase [Bacteroidales bacterium]